MLKTETPTRRQLSHNDCHFKFFHGLRGSYTQRYYDIVRNSMEPEEQE